MNIIPKLLRMIRGMRINKKAALSGHELDLVLVSSMYAAQQIAYLNSYTLGIGKNELQTMLSQYWQITDKESAFEILQHLKEKHQDPYQDILYRAYENEGDSEVILSEIPQELYSEYVYYLECIQTAVKELVEANYIKDYSEIKHIKDSGWNLGRGAYIARVIYDLGWIDGEALKEILETFYQQLKSCCNTWEEYVKSYVFGRAIWGGSYNHGMMQVGNDLLNNNKSPLKGKTAI